MSVMVPSPIAGILAPLASTKFMACLPPPEAPSSQQFQRPEGAVLIASQTRTGYWMPRLCGAVTGCPACAGRVLDAPPARGMANGFLTAAGSPHPLRLAKDLKKLIVQHLRRGRRSPSYRL